MKINFLRALRVLMAEDGMNQSDLARRMGMSRQAVNNVMNDAEYNPTLRTMQKYADVFGVTVSDFIELGERDNVPRSYQESEPG